jgi:CRP/FNR family transcriptional regulator
MESATTVAKSNTAKQITCNHCLARKSCLISTLNSTENSELSSIINHEKPMIKGQRLFLQGDKFQSLFLIRSGCFKSCIVDESGERQVTGFHFSTDILGIDGIDSQKYTCEVEALETSSVCSLAFDFFKDASLKSNQKVYNRLLCAVSCMMFRESHLMMVLGKMKAEQRLAHFLLDISQRMRDRGESAHEFRLSMARYDIANYLGLAVETVSRLFKRLEEQGLIVANRHRVRLMDMDGLHHVIAGGYVERRQEKPVVMTAAV